ncbi:glutaredoxin 3 [Sinisalibacter aestuarii]|uniref:Glutaredoxin n=1 Tax=Sinisalibacter aestuarii TaxID=2949426 RepID=A0ABQ5LN72_9RHOB|nr:glutaredoxin 3 [Sinisalibacter aestuarii]GKY86430.1 glutaredoxin [Sinisalibacter aestuarii]
MQPVTMYTKPYCGFCHAAKRLLAKKGVEFTEIDIQAQPELRQEMIQKSGQFTVPQIWIGETHVGGFDDMYDLEQRGKLDPLLQG